MLKKNIILITIDGLRYDRTGFGGYGPSASPFIDTLMHDKFSFTNAFSTSFPTQFALPALFTSTLPLDNGGYNKGIRDRKSSFVEVLNDHGYMTTGFFSGFIGSELFHYDRGFDNFFTCCSPFVVFCNFKDIYICHLLKKFLICKDIQSCVDFITPLFEDLFSWFIKFCNTKHLEIKNKSLILSPASHNWNFEKIKDLILLEQKKLADNPEKYIEQLIITKGCTGLDNIANLYQRNLSKDIQARSVSASLLINSTIKTIGRYIYPKKTNPFFIWVHLMDVHDSILEKQDIIGNPSHDMFLSDEEKEYELSEITDQNHRIQGAGENYYGSLRYDLAVKYCDIQIQKLMTFLERKKILNDTCVVLTSDHGFPKAGLPERKSVGVGNFYDEMHKIPLVFINPDLKNQKFDSLISSLDIGPSILDYAGLNIPDSFKGKSAFHGSLSNQLNSLIILENMGKLLCDFEIKPIDVCVRTNKNKLVYSVKPKTNPKNGSILEYYELDNDPFELQNIKHHTSKNMDELKSLATKRVMQILNSANLREKG